MNVLLIGGTGLLGNNVLECLLERGQRVRVAARNAKRIAVDIRRYEDRCKIEIANIADKEDLMRLAKGSDAIVNCAGETDMSLGKLEDYYPMNRDLCGNLIAVAKEIGLKTIVHVSTANTIGYGTRGRESDETEEMKAPFDKSKYATSKREGEEILLERGKKCGIRVVIVNPGYIIGKYDQKPTSGKMIDLGWKKRVMIAPKGGKSFVSAKTVAEAVVGGMERGRDGERYLATGENMTFKQFYELVAKVGRYKQKIEELPKWFLRTVGRMGDVLRVLGIRSSVSSNNVEQLLIEEHYSSKKAERELGIRQQTIEEAIRDYVEYRKGITTAR